MFSIYLDNLRGFSKQLINIADVNFLVGENSTGKTSFLSILKMILSPGFLLNPGFNDQELKMGSFSEIVNQNSKKKNFSIGYYIQDDNKIQYRFVTFKNNDGTPIASKISFINEDRLYTCIVNNSKRFEYIVHDIVISEQSESELYEKTRIEHDRSDRDNYKSIELPNIPATIQTLHYEKIIAADIQGDIFYKNKNSFSFSFEHTMLESVWISPIRAKPQRTYESYRDQNRSDGSHVPQILNTIINKSKRNGNNGIKTIDSLNKFGSESGLFDSIDTRIYGEDLTSPFELDIVKNNLTTKICNVGYGVSQILPIITELLTLNRRKALIVQQPEVHLHPRAQAALGSFLYEHIKNRSLYMIETHSDYLIDRFRLCINKADKNKCTSQVLFFEKIDGNNFVYPIKIDEMGRYDTNQPDGFRDFFINEEIELLRV